MLGIKSRTKAIESVEHNELVEHTENIDLNSNGVVRYAIVKSGKYSTKSNGLNILTTKAWEDVNGFWDSKIEDVIAYIQAINSVDYKFGDGEILIKYEIIPVKHESKLTHEYKIGE